jgi:ATP-binding cassette, subfamily B, multidrug efflux pump
MLKLIKYLKPFTWIIVVIFALLFGQAMADLALPGYMAKIVNVGISANGIENAVPQVIRASELDKIDLFLSDADKAIVLNNYQLLDKTSLTADDYAKDVKKYPGLAESPIYVLSANPPDTVKTLDGIFSKPIFLVSAIEQEGIAALSGNTTQQLPEGTDPFTVISQMPAANLEAIRDKAYETIKALPPTALTAASTGYLIIEYNIIGMSLTSIQTKYILHVGGLMLLITLAGAIASLAVGFLSARVASGLARNLRQRIFTRVESFSNAEFDKFSTASLITRSTNDITQVQMLLVMLFRIAFYAPIIGIGGIIKVLGSEASMSWIIAAAVIAILMMIGIMLIVVVPKFKLIQKLVDKLNLVTREILSGLMVIRAFNTQKHEEEKFDTANKDLTKLGLFISRVTVLMMPVMMLIMNVVMILIVWVGAYKVDAGTVQIGDMMAFMQYAMQIIMSFFMVSMVFVMMPRALVSIQRISEVLETEPAIKDPTQPRKFTGGTKGQIEFKNVSFRYPSAEVDLLKNVSFTIKAGQTVAVIGSTGSGKSTLINLIPRFYDVTGGSIMMDGVDIREVSQHDLREKIGYVSQKTLLFSGTIGSNIRYANEAATDTEVENFARTAQALEFIKQNSAGMETVVSQGGSNFSGGQKQRLSIARALAKKPELFIFDDSFSALDYTTDAALRRALRNETANASVMIVTQRISTIMGSDQIIVLDNGKVVGIGKHRDLLATCEVYREIAQSQLSREELSQ